MIAATTSWRMRAMANTAKLERMYGLINAGDVDGFIDQLSDDFVDHETGPGIPPTKEGARQLFNILVGAFPDLRFDIEDIIESGDKVVARARITGNHKGDFFGVAPSGKRVDVEAIDIVRFDDEGLAYEHWGVMDMMLMMQQVGAVPEGPPA
jgi:steroid delta-isomerase-like uncharacterized protein